MREIARDISARTQHQALSNLDEAAEDSGIAVSADTPDETVYLFVSRSLGQQALGSILKSIAGTPVIAVMRGVPAGMKIDKAVGQIHSLIRDRKIDPPPQVTINPKRWSDYGITVVPTLVLVQHGKEVARVSGVTNADWLRDQVDMGRTGDLGTRGSVKSPSEPDLIAVMKQRASELDMADQKQQALRSYWQNVAFNELPAAAKDETRPLDLSVLVQRDITTPDGQVIARKGQKIDPLDAQPFTNRLVIFDATRPEQREFAKSEAANHENAILISTRFDRDSGWQGFKELEDAVNAPVYRMTHDIQRRYDVRAIPSVVYAQSRHRLVVQQYALKPGAE